MIRNTVSKGEFGICSICVTGAIQLLKKFNLYDFKAPDSFDKAYKIFIMSDLVIKHINNIQDDGMNHTTKEEWESWYKANKDSNWNIDDQ